jgi:replicative DNA helicase
MIENKFEESSEYQQKLIANLIFDSKFLDNIHNFIKPDMFDLETHQWLTKAILSYYNKYMKPITFDAIGVLMKKISDEAKRKDVARVAYTIFKLERETIMQDYEFVQEHSLKFCKTMSFKNALLEASEHAVKGDVDIAFNIIQKNFFDVTVTDDGVDVDDLEHRLKSETRKNVMSLPWVNLNKRIGGGLAEGEMMCVVAPMGVGKSMVAINTGVHSKKINKNAVLFTFELNPEYNRHRFDSILLDRESDNLVYNSETMEEIGKQLNMYKGKLFIKKFLANNVNVNSLRAYIRKLKSKGHEIHYVIVDYLDVMDTVEASTRHLQGWEKMEQVSRELDAFADEEGVRVIALAQGNTQSINQKIITAQNTGGGAKRLHPFDLIFGFARTDEDKVSNTGTWSVIKNRFGADGYALNVVTDYTKSFLDILDDTYVVDDDTVKANIKQRYEKFANKKKKVDEDDDKNEPEYF